MPITTVWKRHFGKKKKENINRHIIDKEIQLNEKSVPVRVTLGGDRTFPLTILGLKAANSNFSCLYCSIQKDDRWQTEYEMNYYHTEQKRDNTTQVQSNPGQ